MNSAYAPVKSVLSALSLVLWMTHGAEGSFNPDNLAGLYRLNAGPSTCSDLLRFTQSGLRIPSSSIEQDDEQSYCGTLQLYKNPASGHGLLSYLSQYRGLAGNVYSGRLTTTMSCNGQNPIPGNAVFVFLTAEQDFQITLRDMLGTGSPLEQASGSSIMELRVRDTYVFIAQRCMYERASDTVAVVPSDDAAPRMSCFAGDARGRGSHARRGHGHAGADDRVHLGAHPGLDACTRWRAHARLCIADDARWPHADHHVGPLHLRQWARHSRRARANRPSTTRGVRWQWQCDGRARALRYGWHCAVQSADGRRQNRGRRLRLDDVYDGGAAERGACVVGAGARAEGNPLVAVFLELHAREGGGNAKRFTIRSNLDLKVWVGEKCEARSQFLQFIVSCVDPIFDVKIDLY